LRCFPSCASTDEVVIICIELLRIFTKLITSLISLSDKFDIIMGNPPYNKNNTGTGNSIWQFFVKKSINDLKKKGF
jgi:16S rRNA G1207 methylase RsmC